MELIVEVCTGGPYSVVCRSPRSSARMVEYNRSSLGLRKGFVDRIGTARPAMQLCGLPPEILHFIVWVELNILLLRIRGVLCARRMALCFPV